MNESAIDKLDVARKLKNRTEIFDFEDTIEDLEASQPPL